MLNKVMQLKKFLLYSTHCSFNLKIRCKALFFKLKINSPNRDPGTHPSRVNNRQTRTDHPKLFLCKNTANGGKKLKIEALNLLTQ